MATTYGGDWSQADTFRMADIRNLTLRGDPKAAEAWQRITERDPEAARLAAAWDDERTAQQAEANALADMVISKAKKIKIKCKICKKKHGMAEPCKTGDSMSKKRNKYRRASLIKAYRGSYRQDAPTLAQRQEEWRAESIRWAWGNADPVIREAWRSRGHSG